MQLTSRIAPSIPAVPAGRLLHGGTMFLLIGLGVILSANTGLCEEGSRSRRPPNVVLILADDHAELYNLKDDPGETKNLAESLPELTGELRAELDAWQAETNAPIPTERNPECILP